MSWFPLTSGADPVPGDSAVVARAGRDYSDVADKISAAARRLREIGAPSVTMSQATDAVRVQALKVADDVERAHRRYSTAGSALTDYGVGLAAAQERADGALADARAAVAALDNLEVDRRYRQSRLDGAQRAADAAVPEPGAAEDLISWRRMLQDTSSEVAVAEARLQQARDLVPPIQADVRRAADRARDLIGAAVENDGLSTTFWERVGQVALQVTKVLAHVSELVAQIAGTLALVLAFVPFLQPLAAVLGTVALVAAAVNLVTTGILVATGDASLSDLVWSAVGLASFGAGKLVTIAARTAVTRAVGTAVLEARQVAPTTGRTVTSLLRSTTLTKMSSSRATALAGSRWLATETPLAPQLAAQIPKTAAATIVGERVGARTAFYAEQLAGLSPDLAAASARARSALALAGVGSSGVIGGAGYEAVDALLGLRSLVEAGAGAGYVPPLAQLGDLTWVNDWSDPIDSQAALHLPTGN